MSNEPGDDDQPHEDLGTTNPVYAAVARSLTRGAALYFSRPIRLFRPSKSKHLHCRQPTIIIFLAERSDLQAKSAVGNP